MFFLGLGFLLGTVLGSFAKALADRSLVGRSFWGRSYCSSCKRVLGWYDLFPILSYIKLGGRCRYCHKKISQEYLVVELIMGLLIGFLFWQSFARVGVTGFSFQYESIRFIFDLVFKTFFTVVLVIVTITDLRKSLIPDRIIIPSIFAALILFFIFTIYRISYLYYYLSQTAFGRLLLPPHDDYFQRHALLSAEPFLGAVLSAVLIFGFFLLLIIITRGKGMGGGDPKLGAFIGICLGFPSSILAVILAFLSGAAAALGLIFLGKKRFGENIPFGPFLVLGSLVALFWGNQIMDWYINLSS